MKRFLGVTAIALIAATSLALADVPPPPAFIAAQNEGAQQTVLLGNYASSILQWMLPIIAPVVAAFLVDALIKLRQMLGQTTSEAQRAKLQEMAENAVNLAGHELGKDLKGKISVPDKSAVMAKAVDYIQFHGADTIKALSGIDPTDPKAVQALQARVATILASKEAATT